MSWMFLHALDSTVAISRTSMWTAHLLRLDQGLDSLPLDTRTRKAIPINQRQKKWGLDSRRALNWLSPTYSRGFIKRWNWFYSNSTVSWRKMIIFFQFQNFRQSRTENVYCSQRAVRNSFSVTYLWTLYHWISLSYITILWPKTDFLSMGTKKTTIKSVFQVSSNHNKIPKS